VCASVMECVVECLGLGLYTMGWLRLVGSLKLQVSFAKEPYKIDYILQKRHNFKEPTTRSHPIYTLRSMKPYLSSCGRICVGVRWSV